jgi:hypothetical protein
MILAQVRLRFKPNFLIPPIFPPDLLVFFAKWLKIKGE